MYYEYLIKNAGALSQAAQMEKKAMSPAKVLPILEKFNNMLWNSRITHSMSPRVNPISHRLKGGLTGKDVTDVVRRHTFNSTRPEWGTTIGDAGADLLSKQYPYLYKLLKGRISLGSLSGFDKIYNKEPYVKAVSDVLSSNSPTLRKALVADLPKP